MNTKNYRIAGLNLKINLGKVTFPKSLERSFAPFSVDQPVSSNHLLTITLYDAPIREPIPFASHYTEEIAPVIARFGPTLIEQAKVEQTKIKQAKVEECYCYYSQEIEGGAKVCSFIHSVTGEAGIYIWGEETQVGVRCQLLRMALWATFGTWAVRHGRLFLHSSVTVVNVAHARAILFLGESGTGKSTQSRLWLESFPDAWMLNDDSPMISIQGTEQRTEIIEEHRNKILGETRNEGLTDRKKDISEVQINGLVKNEILVYGTPWSGKTPCYRPEGVPVEAIVRLSQGRTNIVTPLTSVKAFAALQPSAPPMFNADEALTDQVCETLSTLISQIKSYHLTCTPDSRAVECLHPLLFPNPDQSGTI